MQDGLIREFPVWAKLLAKLGRYMSTEDGTKDGDMPRIAVVCLPRIDYAALFTSYGALHALTNFEESSANSQSINLEALVNRTVSYLKIKGQETTTILGRLESVDRASGTASLTTRRDKKANFVYSIDRKDWHWVRESDMTFDITKGATNRQTLRAGEAYSEYHKIAATVGNILASAATRTSGAYLTIVGEKSRFFEEIESLTFCSNETSIPAGILLNSGDDSGKHFRNGGRYIELLASSRNLSEAESSVVVVEAGRALGDQLQQLGENKRAIILVAANKRSHNDVVDLLAPFINFRGRKEPVPDLKDTPQYLKIIFLR